MFDQLFNFVTTIVTDNIGTMVVLFADVITPLIGASVHWRFVPPLLSTHRGI
ncbi:hypothetical protein [Vibrio hepatarius]|uniref:hypothetical protein n=1 Tax=Vibrio hepatarius TaxID=171383 RepID=UPI0020CA35C1|nr:hypothetical protein [Vibrio hepatarius]